MILTFGEKLLILKKRHKLSVKTLSFEWGVSERAIVSYESDKTIPTADIAAKIARFYGVSADWLLGIKEDMV